MVRCRYAPSPTGALHVGNARTALLAWLQARALGGAFVVRMEDLDKPREVPGAARRILEDLRWLGLDCDEGPDVEGAHGPYVQSERTGLFEAALERLRAGGRVFPCTCSRAEVARAATAPHGPSDDGPRYPGTCRSGAGAPGRKPAWRLRVPDETVAFVDGFRGAQAIDVAGAVGDFVVRRADGVFAYQLAAAVDDARMGITHVLRGDDLLASTPRQILVLEALGERVPAYFHVPLVTGPGGDRLQKRAGDVSIGALRERGVPAPRVVGHLAAISGLAEPGVEATPSELVPRFRLEAIPARSVEFDAAQFGRTAGNRCR